MAAVYGMKSHILVNQNLGYTLNRPLDPTTDHFKNHFFLFSKSCFTIIAFLSFFYKLCNKSLITYCAATKAYFRILGLLAVPLTKQKYYNTTRPTILHTRSRSLIIIINLANATSSHKALFI